jgi:hypothetical protein
MALTRSQFESEIDFNLGGSDGRDDVTSARKVIALNIAQEQATRYYNWRELESVQTGTLTASTKTLTFPTNPRNILSFRLDLDGSRSRKLIHIPVRMWDRMIPEPEAHTEGVPEYYTYYGNAAEMWRIPDSNYKYELRYTAWPTDFTTGSDVASDLLGKDDALLALATSWLLSSLGEHTRARSWFVRGRAVLKDARSQDIKQTDLGAAGKTAGVSLIGEYWENPWIKTMP